LFARASGTGWPGCGFSPCRPRGSSPATGSPAVTPDSAPAPRTCLLHSTLSDEIAGNKNTTRRTNPSDTCLHTQLPMGAEHQLIDGKDNSDPPPLLAGLGPPSPHPQAGRPVNDAAGFT